MVLESIFQVRKDEWASFISGEIISKLPQQSRVIAQDRILKIIGSYAGFEVYALSTLAYAAESKRFDEFALMLEKHYDENLGHFAQDHKPVRKDITNMFFDMCYSKLNI